jgi:hypothetical protein
MVSCTKKIAKEIIMSIGLYIVVNKELQELTREDDFHSLNELLHEGYSKKELINTLKNLGIDGKEINPDDKIFCIDIMDSSISFQIVRDLGGNTINKYLSYMESKSIYCYEIVIDDLERFYPEFMNYLKTVDFPFEIWKIWEDLYEPDDIKVFNFANISERHLKMIIEDNTYVNPILGRFCR